MYYLFIYSFTLRPTLLGLVPKLAGVHKTKLHTIRSKKNAKQII